METRRPGFSLVTLVVFIILLGVHGVVVLIFVIKVVVGVVGQVAQADGDHGGNVGVNFFRTPETTAPTLNNHILLKQHFRPFPVVPPDEGLEGLDAVLSQLVVVNVTELHHQRNDLLQILSCRHRHCESDPERTDVKHVSRMSHRSGVPPVC